ncbi:uncharacterized protein LOC113237210 isoform X2 [Hyposmocoma kahamanoa]|uniref:uncharacterized protein LOC113237210 isoform X2 n=1 Tax=Hyposmocoma kahamanoa TaxID=1477025 RepID=UPI000E6DA568|nr:uncharacterized protein LOC113237210 isoform X2 [Hyposmocoma kahamanoa]
MPSRTTSKRPSPTSKGTSPVRLAKDRKKGDKIVSDSQERAYWRVARPPPGQPGALEHCPVPVRARHQRPKRRNIEQIKREIEHLKTSLDRTRVKTSIALEALLAYSETFAPYDPWLTAPQPSNPWISDDTLFWQINSPLVEVPSEKRVQRWALSIEELLSDPTGLQEFTSFLRKEYSHENIRFWLAVMDLRRSSAKQIPTKLDEIYEEFLKPGAPCEINIDGATAEKVAEGLRSGSRYALDHAADHVYGLLLKKDCYPRFVRSDHFQRLLTEGRNVHQKKAKFFNFGGQVKKKPGSTTVSGVSGSVVVLARRRGSDRSLSGSAHELAVCAAQPPRMPDPPPHSHSQSNLCDIPFRDPLDDCVDEALPWESASREGVYGATRRRQDSAADSGSSSSDLSAAVVVGGPMGERRRLPQQSTLDGGLRGAPPPLRRLSAVEPRHLAPLGSPPHSPRPPRPAPAPAPAPASHPHPTPTISVSSAPDDESPAGTGSPDRRSLVHSDEPSSVFASVDVTPTEPREPTPIADASAPSPTSTLSASSAPAPVPAQAGDKTVLPPSCDSCRSDVSKVEVRVETAGKAGCASPVIVERSDSKDSKRPISPEDEVVSVRGTLSREPSTIKEISPASCKDSSKIADLPGSGPKRGGPIEMAPTVEPPNTISTGRASPTSAAETSIATCSTASSVASTSAATPALSSANISVEAGRLPVPPVAPLAVWEDTGVDDDNVDKVPSAPVQRVSGDSKAASESDAMKQIAHKDELSSVSESNIVKRDNKSELEERKKRNDICPWEDENSCESEAPFVKTYATLGYL